MSNPKDTPERLKLDKQDKKILFHLSRDMRIPKKPLAKKLRISEQLLHYKIERLKHELITPITLFNYQLLGLNMYLLLLGRLKETDLQKILSHDSLIFSIRTLNKNEYILNLLTDDILNFCKENLADYHIRVIPIIKQIPDFYNPFNINEKEILQIKKDKKIVLDNKDYKILLHIAKYPEDFVLKISNTTKIDRQTIKKRISRLIDSNIIQEFRYSLDIFKLGFTTYFLKVKTIPKLKQKILNLIRNNSYSGIVFETYSEYIFFYLPPSYRDLYSFTEILKQEDPTIDIEIIQSTEFFTLRPIPNFFLKFLERKIKK